MAATTTATYSELIHVGFEPRQAAVLVNAAPDYDKAILQRVFTKRQATVLRAAFTLTTLIRNGGFTRPQAKLLTA